MFDLADFDLSADAERGATVELLNPVTGLPLVKEDGQPVTISVKGADGETYDEAQWQARQAAEHAPLDERKRRAYFEEKACGVLGAVTTAWDGIAVDGEAWECSVGAAAALYRRFPWIRAQVDATVNDRRRFGKPVADAA